MAQINFSSLHEIYRPSLPLPYRLLLLVFYWVLNSVETLKKRNILVVSLIISSTLAALFGFYQTWEAGVLNPQTRVEGTFSIYMTFAGILMMVGLVAASRWIFNRYREHWLLLPIVIISLCLVLTLTRQAWLGFLVGSIFLVYFWEKKFLWIIPLVLVSVFLLSPQVYKDRIKSMTDISTDVSFQERQVVINSRLTVYDGNKIDKLIHNLSNIQKIHLLEKFYLNWINSKWVLDNGTFSPLNSSEIFNQFGTINTPDHIAKTITEQTTKSISITNKNSLYALDFACGTGVFYFQLLNILKKKFKSTSRDIVKNNLFV